MLALFGTRPELIKLAPVIRALERRCERLQTITVTSSQHTDLLDPLLRLFAIRVDADLQVGSPDQHPSEVCARVLARLDPLLARRAPDLLLVQGDTSTALAGALAGFRRRIPVAHVEAGLRSGNPLNPYPEEMNRRLITRLTTYHFAATLANQDTLLAEGVAPERIFVTGNPVVDALMETMERATPERPLQELLERTNGSRRIVLTTHRRESFASIMAKHLRILRRFVDRHPDVSLLFPVHPNPNVVSCADRLLSGHDRIHRFGALNYDQFVALAARAWLIVTDSGGLQEEAPTLGKPLIVIRANTERAEAIDSGVARLTGEDPDRLMTLLEQADVDLEWGERVCSTPNPFGRGDSGERIARLVEQLLGAATANASVRAADPLAPAR